MREYRLPFTEIDRNEKLESRKQILDWVWETAKNILLEFGNVIPVLVIVKPKRILLGMMGEMLANDEAKEDFARFVKGLTAQPDVQGYILVAEIWYYIGEKGTVLKPSELSDKNEALFLQSEWVDGEEVRKSAKIHRDGGKILLEEDLDLGPAVNGRFSNLMNKKAEQ